MTEAFIYDHVRTPRGRGKPDGSLHTITAVDLAAQTLGAIKSRNGFGAEDVDDIVWGTVMPLGEQGQVLPRMASMMAGYGEYTGAVQVNRFCASGLEACNLAAAQVMSGQAQMTIGGGVEMMSRVMMGSDGGAYMIDPQVATTLHAVPQGISADLLASLYGYSREDVDSYAVASHQRAAHAWTNGYFDNSVIPVVDVNGVTVLERDETVRGNTTVEALAKLKPSFEKLGRDLGFDSVAIQKYPQVEKIVHLHHAGNSSGVVDGSGAVLIGSREAGERLGLKPRARIRSWATLGTDPTIMLIGPSFAAEKALANAGMSASDIDLWELNEAFAAVVLRFMEVLDVPHDRINVNGGAIAMGHPMGATGAMVLGTVLDELERREMGTALTTLCIGGGMGIATIIERV
ncbi:MAG: acetyl-CoA C-acetyltransferase [Rhodobacteraceae bacterium]|nr:acetyl-CoA C-acetyltransferase [Paracoccaceae bacterium]